HTDAHASVRHNEGYPDVDAPRGSSRLRLLVRERERGGVRPLRHGRLDSGRQIEPSQVLAHVERQRLQGSTVAALGLPRRVEVLPELALAVQMSQRKVLAQ